MGRKAAKRGVPVAGLLALALAAPLAVLAYEAAGPAPGSLSDDLWQAIVAVESGGDPAAYNARSGASGIVQIRTVCLDDVNRIARARGVPVQFSSADRRDPDKSRQMWELYLAYYGEQYEKQTGQPPTNEVYARIWNGGPTGWHKESTAPYWDRIRAAMPDGSDVAGLDGDAISGGDPL